MLHIDYSLDSSFLQVSTQKYEMLYFDVKAGKRVQTPMNDIKWATWTCPAGWPVKGIADSNTPRETIHAVDYSPINKTLTVCDMNGFVKLFKYPCPIPCKYFSYF